ncbi:MAG: TM2 domain-containing protein [Verrucomicrobiaceae bacterium]
MSEEEDPSAESSPTPQPPAPAPGAPVPGADKKILCGILGILLGTFGVHKFILGYTKEGIIMLIVGLLTCWNIPVMAVIGLVEGIIYLTKSDQEFVDMYVKGKKGWF